MSDVENRMSTSMFADQQTYGCPSYRSVAFGTWKVDQTKRFERFKRHRTPELKTNKKTIEKKDQTANLDATRQPTNSQSSVVRLAEAEDEMSCTASGDFYSSSDYVRYCAQNSYENVLVGNPLRRQSTLNRSMDALNDRIVHYAQHPPTFSRNELSATLNRNWRVRREFVVDPGPLSTPLVGRFRAKSCDHAQRTNVVAPTKLKRQDDAKSTFQSAKNFLRRFYATSTLRLRGRNTRKMDAAEQRFREATAPFYQSRRPDPGERPFLPYNIRYEVENEDDVILDSRLMNTPPSSSSSPDEGFSAGEESTSSSTRSNHNPQRPASTLSSNSSGLATFSDRPFVSPERFRNWNDLYDHLKKEMSDLRNQDAQILQNLMTIEEELIVVKAAAV
ncbi:hypothetical protein M3Y95_01148400 [Aphelenchoides besseyi]|nr:hypothetical protein M3Y95_01148400 [Aphelenchoides besseyi]